MQGTPSIRRGFGEGESRFKKVNGDNMKLKQYSFPEWIVCLEENVLLDYALPIFSRVLQEYPMLCGMQCEWQVLYEITKIKEDFWMIHKKWKEYFIEILKGFCSNYTKEELIDIFSEEYFYQFETFIGNEDIKNNTK